MCNVVNHLSLYFINAEYMYNIKICRYTAIHIGFILGASNVCHNNIRCNFEYPFFIKSVCNCHDSVYKCVSNVHPMFI